MSAAMRKMSSFFGVSGESDQAYEDVYADSISQHEDYDNYADEDSDEHPGEQTPADLRRIVTVHPSTYNEARVIGESFRDGVPVIVNLTGMNDSDARRMVDFCAGLVFGLHGAIERVTPRVFLLTPATVETDSGDGPEPQGHFFNQS